MKVTLLDVALTPAVGSMGWIVAESAMLLKEDSCFNSPAGPSVKCKPIGTDSCEMTCTNYGSISQLRRANGKRACDEPEAANCLTYPCETWNYSNTNCVNFVSANSSNALHCGKATMYN